MSWTVQTITINNVGSGATAGSDVAITSATTSKAYLFRVKVTPSIIGGTWVFKIFKEAAKTNVVYWLEGSGVERDPQLVYNTSVDVVGFLVPYVDADGVNQWHVSITNNDVQTKNFTIELEFQPF